MAVRPQARTAASLFAPATTRAPSHLSFTEAGALIGVSLADRWRIAGEENAPRDEWHSYDASPWNHPWLTPENLRAFRQYSLNVFTKLAQHAKGFERNPKLAFVGNMANMNYTRAAPLRRRGMTVDMFLHPGDTSVFSAPAWEHFAGDARDLDEMTMTASTRRRLPFVAGVHQIPLDPAWYVGDMEKTLSFLQPDDIARYQEMMSLAGTLRALQDYDALLAVQAPYLAYLSGRPYAVAVSGGEIWFEAARDDLLGRLQRRALAGAAAIFVSNPITLAHARRYGFKNALLMPWMIDDEVYHPGPTPESRAIRDQWERQTGGRFFVLMTARLDNAWKGARHAIEGFAQFAQHHPEARLVLLRWGVDEIAERRKLDELGLGDRVIVRPPAGKRRLISMLQASDCLIEQFVLGYYGGSALEAMACRTPVIMRLERAQYDAFCPAGAPPTLDAKNADDVAHALHQLASNPVRRLWTRARSRAWFMQAHSAQRWAETHQLFFAALAAGLRPSFAGSPLDTPLSAEENAYHADQLARAPAFGTYAI